MKKGVANTPIVSVIMGVYNAGDGRRLEQAVQSILAQTLQDWELIICDDGSTDGTPTRLQALQGRDGRIKVLYSGINRKLAAALNRCIDCAGGRYIARMDDDDVSHPERLEKQLRFMEAHPEISFCGTSAQYFSDEGVWGQRCPPARPTKADFLFSNPFIHPSMIIRREALVAVGGYSEEKIMRRAEDYDLWMRLYAAGYEGANLQEILFDYREDKDSFKKRAYRYRVDEARVRLRGFRAMGMLFPTGWIYVLKPFLVGLIPSTWMIAWKKWRLKGDV